MSAGTLIHLSEARRALESAKSLDDVLKIRDKAEAARVYAKISGLAHESQNEIAEIKIRAERRAGELLAEMNIHGGDRKSKSSCHRDNLISLGIDGNQSSRWQRIAGLAEDLFDAHIERVKASGELTTASVLKLAKQVAAQAATTSADEHDDACHIVADLSGLSGQKFACIYADPPWAYGNQGTRAATDNHYGTMSVEDIAAIPVDSLAADNAHLHLWTTNGFLREAFDIIAAWGFEYKSCMVWVKPQLGIGNYWRVSHEFLLFGIRGSLPFADRSQRSWIEAERTGHSKKPTAFRMAIEKVSPAPRLELFGRETSPGWTVWGNQVSRGLLDVSV